MRTLAALALLAATPAAARDFCPDRPEQANPPCVTEVGRIEIEGSLVDWSFSDRGAARNDTLVFGDLLVRTGVTRSIEARFGLAAYGIDRFRDRSGVSRATGPGDVSLGARWNLRHPDGHGFSVALQTTLFVPTGGDAIGGGDLGGGISLPTSVELGPDVTLGFTPEVDSAVDSDRRGRHLAYSAAVALSVPLMPSVAGSIELRGARDDDPAGELDSASADVALAWRVARDWQVDVSSYIGLTPDTPDCELLFGFARRF